jgi:hypothetical protein
MLKYVYLVIAVLVPLIQEIAHLLNYILIMYDYVILTYVLRTQRKGSDGVLRWWHCGDRTR